MDVSATRWLLLLLVAFGGTLRTLIYASAHTSPAESSSEFNNFVTLDARVDSPPVVRLPELPPLSAAYYYDPCIPSTIPSPSRKHP